MPRPITRKQLLALIQKFTAIDAVGPSAIRGQPKGTAKVIQEYLGRMDLSRALQNTRQGFDRWLDLHTARLRRKLPNPAQPWGIARKTLNLFLRSCFYNHYLRRAYRLAEIGQWLEVPLDSVVAEELRNRVGTDVLRPWPTLKHLTPEESREYQRHARAYAASRRLPATVFLDNYLWLSGRRR